MMRLAKYSAVALLLASVATSCVSKRKHEALRARATSDSLALTQDLRLAREQGSLYLRQRDALRDSLEATRTELAGTRAQLARLGKDLHATNQSLEMLRSNSQEGMRQLLLQQEALRQDLLNRELRLADVEGRLRARDSLLRSLEIRLNAALSAFAGQGLAVQIRKGRVHVSMADRLLFELGQTNIDTVGRSALRQLALVLAEVPNLGVVVEGHTDSLRVVNLRCISDNWDLSVKRSTEVVRFLTTAGGLDPRRITATGRSEYFPVAANITEEGRARNRRTEIILTPDLTELYELLENPR